MGCSRLAGRWPAAAEGQGGTRSAAIDAGGVASISAEMAATSCSAPPSCRKWLRVCAHTQPAQPGWGQRLPDALDAQQDWLH